MFGGTWKRAWYFIQDGKLYTFPKSNSTNPKIVADLIISSCSLSKTKNDRFCFEIRTPSERNAIVLQAGDEQDCSTWMEAIKQGVESALNNQSAVVAALSNREQEEEEGSALTPETFLLQATRSKTLEVNRNTGK